jgi:hypothetical protein
MEETLSDLIRDWKLEGVVDCNYTIQTRYVSNPATGLWRSRVEERWQRTKVLGRGSFGVVWLEECTSGPSSGKVRAVKELKKHIGASCISPASMARELDAIIKFSHERVWSATLVSLITPTGPNTNS